jgi:hypothetical protein
MMKRVVGSYGLEAETIKDIAEDITNGGAEQGQNSNNDDCDQNKN